ncbi:MAG: hypothetical protein GKR90_23095 [Pseudomonadales bacterium]|nr:hypothetical protein [Pseudomonadales bacterium]
MTSEDQSSGVANEEHLRALTEAAISGDWLALPKIRDRAELAMGLQNTVDVLVVAAAFNGITRVADATGIPLDQNTADVTTEMREATGIQRFNYAEKTQRYG